VEKKNILAIVIFILAVVILVLIGVIANMYDGYFSIPAFFETNIFFVFATSLTVSLVFLVFSKLMFPPDDSTIKEALQLTNTYKDTNEKFTKSIDDTNSMLSDLRMQIFCANFPNICKHFLSTDTIVESMKEDIIKSSRVICFTARGDTATMVLDKYLDKIRTDAEFLIILVNENSPSMPIRAKALNMTNDDYVALIKSQVTAIQVRTRGNSNVKILYHTQPICFRFILLDNCIYWGFYENKAVGTVTDMFKADSASVAYKAFCQYYELLHTLEGWGHKT